MKKSRQEPNQPMHPAAADGSRPAAGQRERQQQKFRSETFRRNCCPVPTIVSKLDAKQAARTGVLSSAWKHAWKLSPKLTLDMVAICGAGYRSYHASLNRKRYVQRFIDIVDAILRQRRGNVIEQLELRFDVADLRRVSRRLGEWVRFAVSSWARSLTLDVSVTSLRMHRSDWYALPLQLLDAGGGVSILQHIHLSCVSLKLSSPSFPKLKRLHLCYASVSAADLGHMLSNCPNLEWLDMFNLEWLDMYKVHLDDDDELRVDTPLSRLLYLRLSNCRVTKIELNASKLTTFIFQGDPLPAINLGGTPGLCDVNIHCYIVTLQDALSSLLDAFRMAQRLSLCCTCVLPEFPWRVENTSRFSRLRHLQLILNIRRKHADDVLSIAYFLEAAPLLEELDIVLALSCKNGRGEPLRSLPHGQFEYKCLKSLKVCEFRGQKSQVELLVHIVENASVLQILTIDPRPHHVPEDICQVTEGEERNLSKIRRMVTTFIGGELLATTKFIVI